MKKMLKWLLGLIKSGEIWHLFFFIPGVFRTHRRAFMRELYTEFNHFHFTKERSTKQLEGLHQLMARDGRIRISMEGAELGTHVLVLEKGTWVRPDLLYRYEQVLRSQGEELVLHTRAVGLDKKGRLVPGTLFQEPRKTFFPYEMAPVRLEGLLIPRALYSPGVSSHELEARGAKFLGIPLPLLGKRSKTVQQGDFVGEFENYVAAKGLPWKIEPGLLPGSVRAIPALVGKPKIQAIVPFKENRALTLAAIHSLLKSEGVEVMITAVDNGSRDRSIGETLKGLGCEVLRIEEPFNYSRLNNVAVRQTRRPQELLFFMNNDAEMAPDALLELSRWIDQPRIGMVGARLHYPSGGLQHGGVALDPSTAIPGAVNYHHPEIGLPFEKCTQARLIRIVDAVTAAAALIRRDRFLALGGFDELLYPIAYSDTNLAHRLSQQGYLSLYTPYAVGTHHESLTREPGLHEDFDRSQFLRNIRHPDLAWEGED